MLKPCIEAVKTLFYQKEDLNEILVTDCLVEIFDDDIKKIQEEKTLKTHLQGVYYLDRKNIENLSGISNSWSSLLEPFITIKKIEEVI